MASAPPQSASRSDSTRSCCIIRVRAAPNAPIGPIGPAQMYRLLRGNAETLGYRQDYTVGALTDLIGLL